MSLVNINTELGEIIGENGTLVENIASLVDEVQSTYIAVQEKGGTVPENKNTANMATAVEGI